MSGFGERFRKAGYEVPKPLIFIDGKPMIAHVIDLFRNEENHNFLFICNKDHINNSQYNLKQIINKYCNFDYKIMGIEPHKKGPCHAILQAKDYLSIDDEIIVNYCDFTCYFDPHDFFRFIRKKQPDGIIVGYKGFHPHSLGKTNYAYLKQDELGNIIDIQEKKPFTDNKMNEFAASGTFYFSSAQLLLDSINYVYENNLTVEGEYYISLAYKYMFEKKMNVITYELQHFMQWGTPQDVEEYNFWSDIFKKLNKYKTKSEISEIVNIFLIAGEGKRFLEFKKQKPLISLNSSNIFIEALKMLPRYKKNYLFSRISLLNDEDFKKSLDQIKFMDCQIHEIKKLTLGQASTANEILITEQIDNKTPINICSCDVGAHLNPGKIKDYLNFENNNADILVWTAENYLYAKKNPNSYGWVKEERSIVKDVSVKKPFNSKCDGSVIAGIFTFKNKEIYINCYNEMVNKKDLINNEFYIDSMIKHAIFLGYKVIAVPIDLFISWGTPNEYLIYKYWDSCFTKWKTHPYKKPK